MSSSNYRPPTPSTSSIRNALGVTPGWGIGMSNSGSYVSTNTRTTLSFPISGTSESSATYDAIKNIVLQKKIREASALRAAKLKQQQTYDNDRKKREQSEKKARDAASAKVTELKSQLEKLFSQQKDLEKNVQYSWKEKVDEFEERSVREEEDELNKLRQEQKQHMEKVRVEYENMEENNFGGGGVSRENNRKGKRKAERQEGEVSSSRKKKQKVGGDSTTSKGKRGGDINQAGHGDVTTETAIVKAKGGSEETELAKGDNGNGDAEKEVLESAKKDRELEEIVDEMNHLNKTKSQMVWLLKQVITAEKKLRP